jgi:alpha-beta hydrolase superfamily lysophospholipase
MLLKTSSVITVVAPAVWAREQPIHVQNNTWNSIFTLAPAQIAAANLSSTLVNNIEVATNFERTNWATGSITEDRFYNAPPVNTSTPPGTLLAVEEVTDTDLYTLAPGLALSRILFVSETLNGTAVPASAYILWPWQAKIFRNSPVNISGVPIVGWGHGTSGVHGDCAPSHIRNLWYQYSAPYTLALQGYAVVAPDYAGLGVNRTAEGKFIPHEYTANHAGANDIFFAIEAAQTAFPELSKHFVTMGHSQGGGIAWAAAERQHTRPVQGYLGTIAGSPVTNITTQMLSSPSSLILAKFIIQTLQSIFPTFSPSDMLTEHGTQLYLLSEELGACNSVEFQLFANPQEWLRSDWLDSWYIPAYVNMTAAGGYPISGPMLVLQGTSDPVLNYSIATAAVENTCAMFPESQIEYAVAEGASHVPALYASQQIWLEWIADRFAGLPAGDGCSRRDLSSLRPVGTYQAELTYYLQLALEPYVVA